MIASSQLTIMAGLLEEAAGHIRSLLLDEDESGLAVQLGVREYLPDELEGSALMLRDLAKEQDEGAQPKAGGPR